MKYKALTIAWSDCSGGAPDLKTFSAHGVFGMSVITSVVPHFIKEEVAFQALGDFREENFSRRKNQKLTSSSAFDFFIDKPISV